MQKVCASEARTVVELLWSTSRANFCIEGCRQSSEQSTLPSTSTCCVQDRVEELEERLKEHRAFNKCNGPSRLNSDAFICPGLLRSSGKLHIHSFR